MECPYYTIDTKSVIFERFENEVIAIHLDRGIYYSLNEPAADIFELAAHRPSSAEIVAALARIYAADEGTIQGAVEPFLELLLGEKLIGTVASGGLNGNWTPPEGDSRKPFEAPTCSAHRDMQELFLLDPVHDVGEAGWPEPRPSGE